MIVAFPAGGTLDTLARIISQKLSEKWGKSVLVENRPGAGGNIGAATAARASPDGYTLHFGAQTLAVNVTIAPQEGFDPVKDFDPIILVATAQDVLMVPGNSPFHSVKELIDYAKAHPEQLNYATLGPGTSAHLATVLFSDLVGIKMQNVPYSSVAQATTDLMSEHVSFFIPTLGGHLGTIKAGNLRALAVSGSARADQLPDVPTFKEMGVPFVEETSWYGIYAPKGTPSEIIAKVNGDVSRILETEGEECGAGLQVARRSAGKARRNAQERDREMGECCQERLARRTLSSRPTPRRSRLPRNHCEASSIPRGKF
jgi:tripartite-type tricarboxylate transporter receptor subunit TctC